MRSRKELTEVTAQEYRGAARAAKGRILQQFCHSTGYNRAYAAMLLRGYRKRRLASDGSEVVGLHTTKGRRHGGGRPPLYDAPVQEQKNFDTVRKLVGYVRYSSSEALQALNELYRVQGLLQNYVLPSHKLLEKKRVGSRVYKRHDQPLSPAERVLRHPQISKEVKAKVRRVRAALDPLSLADEVAQLQRRLLALAEDQRRVRTLRAATQ